MSRVDVFNREKKILTFQPESEFHLDKPKNVEQKANKNVSHFTYQRLNDKINNNQWNECEEKNCSE